MLGKYSLRRIPHTLCFCIFAAVSATAQDIDLRDIELETITVTSRFSRHANDMRRSVTILDRDDIQNCPARTIPDILRYIEGVDVQTRGPGGVQADISLRGSTFEQTAVLVDGVRVNDPQTGHHDMDIPIAADDIERIEILRGHGSSIYGSDAIGGVINIITRSPSGRNASIETFAGDNNTRGASVRFSELWGPAGIHVSAQARSSSGYSYDTDSDITTLFCKTSFDMPLGTHTLSIGYVDKEFGAFDFYTPGAGFPSREYTATRYAAYSGNIPLERITIRPGLYYRRHYDKYILDKTDPDLYLATHVTEIRGGSSYAEVPFGAESAFTLGIELREEEIDSSTLGEHINNETGIATKIELPIIDDRAILDIGMRSDFYSSTDAELSPSFSGLVRINRNTNIRLAVGKAFRVPTFTELYYNSPANAGDPNLDPETVWSYELGFDYFFLVKPVSAHATLFFRDQDDLIDWIKLPPTAAKWTASNITSAETSGIETSLKWTPVKRASFSTGYTYIDTDLSLEGNYMSKYVLNHPEHQLSCGLDLVLPWQIRNTVRVSYKDREEGDNHATFDLRLSRSFPSATVFMDAVNLFNEDYEDIPGVPLPGRWVTVGTRIEF